MVDGPVETAIETVMREEKADLLIVGAQGHGFLHRITAGSISFHFALRSPFHTLILRPREA